jgi:hypothetical protein
MELGMTIGDYIADAAIGARPDQVRQLVNAAAAIVQHISPRVHGAIRAGTYRSNPGITQELLNQLVDALDAVAPGLPEAVINARRARS